MNYINGIDRQQITLMPVSLNEYIPQTHICRVIDAFTEQLDMFKLGFKYAETSYLWYANTGRRPYDPKMLLSLYIYGYLHRVRSSRRLEAEATRNVEVMWLLNKLKPDDRTICNFRSDNKKALRETFRAFSKMCLELDLYGCEVVATDGTKFRADNSRKNNYNEAKVKNALSAIDKQISEYLSSLDECDKAEADSKRPDAVAIEKALEKLNERKKKYEGIKSQLEQEGVTEVSTVDPDSRLMGSSGDARRLDVCYNIQTVTDSKYGLIVDFDLADRSDDKGNLLNMSQRAKEVLEVDELINLADKGYYDGRDIVACEDIGVSCLVAKPKLGGELKEEGFNRESFTYDKENDHYICPAKNKLTHTGDTKNKNEKRFRVYSDSKACKLCPLKEKCAKGSHRKIQRAVWQDTLDTVDERTLSNKELYRKRQAIVENPFGTVKAIWGYKQLLCRGKEKVTGEISLAYLAYNMRRLINVCFEKRQNPALILA